MGSPEVLSHREQWGRTHVSLVHIGLFQKVSWLGMYVLGLTLQPFSFGTVG